jgi:hypothetical protein
MKLYVCELNYKTRKRRTKVGHSNFFYVSQPKIRKFLRSFRFRKSADFFVACVSSLIAIFGTFFTIRTEWMKTSFKQICIFSRKYRLKNRRICGSFSPQKIGPQIANPQIRRVASKDCVRKSQILKLPH